MPCFFFRTGAGGGLFLIRKEEEAGESVLVCLERDFQRRDGQGGVGQARRFAVPLHTKNAPRK